jgi:hypothetical protein
MNGYTRITIEGHEVGLKFGTEATVMFLTAYHSQANMYNNEGGLTFLGISKIIECGYLNNCALNGKEPIYDSSFFYDWTFAALKTAEGAKEIEKVCVSWYESQYVNDVLDKLNALNAEAEQEEKKTLVLTS